MSYNEKKHRRLVIESVIKDARQGKDGYACDEDELEVDGPQPTPQRDLTDVEKKNSWIGLSSNRPFVNVIYHWFRYQREHYDNKYMLEYLLRSFSGTILSLKLAFEKLKAEADRPKFEQIVEYAKRCYRRWKEIENNEELQNKIYSKLTADLKNTRAYKEAEIVTNHVTRLDPAEKLPWQQWRDQAAADKKVAKRASRPKVAKPFPSQTKNEEPENWWE